MDTGGKSPLRRAIIRNIPTNFPIRILYLFSHKIDTRYPLSAKGLKGLKNLPRVFPNSSESFSEMSLEFLFFGKDEVFLTSLRK